MTSCSNPDKHFE